MRPEPRRAPDAEVTDRARGLRRDMTSPERLLWSRLRARRLGGFKFRRQHPIPPFTVDFLCESPKLVVEVDGLTHSGAANADNQRTAALERRGYHVMRVTNDEVLRSLDVVCEGIYQRAQTLTDGS